MQNAAVWGIAALAFAVVVIVAFTAQILAGRPHGYMGRSSAIIGTALAVFAIATGVVLLLIGP